MQQQSLNLRLCVTCPNRSHYQIPKTYIQLWVKYIFNICYSTELLKISNIQPTTDLVGTYIMEDERKYNRLSYKNTENGKCGKMQFSKEPAKVGWHLMKCFPGTAAIRGKMFTKR